MISQNISITTIANAGGQLCDTVIHSNVRKVNISFALGKLLMANVTPVFIPGLSTLVNAWIPWTDINKSKTRLALFPKGTWRYDEAENLVDGAAHGYSMK